MYEVRITAGAAKVIKKMNPALAKRVQKAIFALESDPRPPGVQKLAGDDAYRIRIGDYRVVYTIIDAELVVTVIRAGHRSEIYREKK